MSADLSSLLTINKINYLNRRNLAGFVTAGTDQFVYLKSVVLLTLQYLV